MASANTDPLQRSEWPESGGEMTASQALRLAWIWWFALLLLPFLVFLAVVWMLVFAPSPGRSEAVAYGFFITSLAWMLITVPGAFLLRNYCFKSYWEGRTVEPRSYLRGMVTIWIAPEIGGLLALLGCLLSGTWVPCLLPAAVAFMLFTPFWPTGRAMVDPVGSAEDDEVFRHPR